MCRRGVHYHEGRVACDGCGLPTDCCLCEPVAGARPATAVAGPDQHRGQPALPPPKRAVAATPLSGRQADEPLVPGMEHGGARVVRRRKRGDEPRIRRVRRRRAPPTGSRTGLDLSPEGQLEQRSGTVEEPPAGQASAEQEHPPAGPAGDR